MCCSCCLPSWWDLHHSLCSPVTVPTSSIDGQRHCGCNLPGACLACQKSASTFLLQGQLVNHKPWGKEFLSFCGSHKGGQIKKYPHTPLLFCPSVERGGECSKSTWREEGEIRGVSGHTICQCLLQQHPPIPSQLSSSNYPGAFIAGVRENRSALRCLFAD